MVMNIGMWYVLTKVKNPNAEKKQPVNIIRFNKQISVLPMLFFQ